MESSSPPTEQSGSSDGIRCRRRPAQGPPPAARYFWVRCYRCVRKGNDGGWLTNCHTCGWDRHEGASNGPDKPVIRCRGLGRPIGNGDGGRPRGRPCLAEVGYALGSGLPLSMHPHQDLSSFARQASGDGGKGGGGCSKHGRRQSAEKAFVDSGLAKRLRMKGSVGQVNEGAECLL